MVPTKLVVVRVVGVIVVPPSVTVVEVVSPVPVMVIEVGVPEVEYAVVIDVTTGAAGKATPIPVIARAAATKTFLIG